MAPGIASLPLRLEKENKEEEKSSPSLSSPSSSPSRKWHRVPLDLDALVRRAWGTRYRETLRVTVHACCRLRRVYFSDRAYEGESALPPEYRLYVPASAAAAAAASSVPKAVVPVSSPAHPAGAGEEEEEEEEGKGKILAGVREAEVATGEVVVGEGEENEGGVAAAEDATAAVLPVASN